MDPQNGNADEAEGTEKVAKPSNPTGGPKPAEPVSAASKQEESIPERRVPRTGMNEAAFASLSRRELLKVAPVVLLGAFAIPRLQEPC